MAIKVVTPRDLILTAADRWYKQFSAAIENPTEDFILYSTDNKKTIYYKLKALNKETATAEDVEAIIGNKSWSWPACNVCFGLTKATICFDLDEEESIQICKYCFLNVQKIAVESPEFLK